MPFRTVTTTATGVSNGLGIYQWTRATQVIFAPPATIDNFRQEVRRTNAKVSIELGQGANMWAAAEMDRGTRVITYFSRDGIDLNWSRFTRWVAVQVEFITLCGEP